MLTSSTDAIFFVIITIIVRILSLTNRFLFKLSDSVDKVSQHTGHLKKKKKVGTINFLVLSGKIKASE